MGLPKLKLKTSVADYLESEKIPIAIRRFDLSDKRNLPPRPF
jgi:hypothetical protein